MCISGAMDPVVDDLTLPDGVPFVQVFILFYFILFYYILLYFILFYFILFY